MPTFMQTSMKNKMKVSILEANKHLGAGDRRQARNAFEAAYLAAQAAGDAVTPVESGTAVLGFTSVIGDDWPSLNGKTPDELLLTAIDAAQSAKVRSRTLEGQLLFARSQARSWLTDALGTELLNQERMQKHLETLAGKPVDEDQFELLFSQWVSSSADGASMKVNDFLERFIEVAGRFKRRVDKAPCSAPCEGGLPGDASVLEKELVALVARDGAGSWESKAAELRTKCSLKEFVENISSESLQTKWETLKPKLKKVIDADQQMSCGHSCSTCPTRHDCQVHDSLKDIEDLN